jgi:hypothetical protein
VFDLLLVCEVSVQELVVGRGAPMGLTSGVTVGLFFVWMPPRLPAAMFTYFPIPLLEA